MLDMRPAIHLYCCAVVSRSSIEEMLNQLLAFEVRNRHTQKNLTKETPRFA